MKDSYSSWWTAGYLIRYQNGGLLVPLRSLCWLISVKNCGLWIPHRSLCRLNSVSTRCPLDIRFLYRLNSVSSEYMRSLCRLNLGNKTVTLDTTLVPLNYCSIFPSRPEHKHTTISNYKKRCELLYSCIPWGPFYRGPRLLIYKKE